LERGAQDYILKNHLDEFRVRRVVRGMIERKAAGDTAFRQQQRAEVTLSCTGDAVLTTDMSGQVTELNRAAETLTVVRKRSVVSLVTYFKLSTALHDSCARSLNYSG
jgi:PAS domain-containing protein